MWPTRGAEVSIQLKLGGTLAVVFRDVAGTVVEGVEVELLAGIVIHEGQEPIARAVSDRTGVARLEHLAEGGTIRVRARGEEHLRTMILVSDRVTTVVEIVLGSVVSGVVTLEDGTPVRDATIACYGPMSGTSATQAEAPIDELGRYALRWIAPGDYHLSIRGTGFASGYRTVHVGPEPAVTIALRLGRSIVAGHVTHETSLSGEVWVRLAARNRQCILTARLARDGSFWFYDVPPGEHTLSAWVNGGGLDTAAEIVVGSGEHLAGNDLVLRRSHGEVELEILGPNGAFVDRLQLYVDDTSIAPPPVGPGRYRFEARVGARTITLQWGGNRSTKVDVDVEEGKTVYKTVRLPE